ncbi:transposase [Streptomonospora algeriensis]|uniref:Transposase n=1 Tax=Streptomonospora algeriensis TaxID=995084 RepID=A0ABW3BCZ8_9ACTN
MLLELLANHGQPVFYLPGLAVNRATVGYRGQGKTDARDAAIIADQARMRRDLEPIRPDAEAISELKLPTSRRTDLVNDRTREVDRPREQLTAVFPALERALEMTNRGPLVLLSGYQTPAALRGVGAKRLESWLRNRKVRTAAALAAAAVQAAERQHTVVPGEKIAAQVVRDLAGEVAAFNEKVDAIDKLIEERFRGHGEAEVIASLPGIGPLLGAEFLAATGADMARFGTSGRLAGFAALVPAPATPGASATTCTVRPATTGDSNGCSIHRR